MVDDCTINDCISINNGYSIDQCKTYYGDYTYYVYVDNGTTIG